MFQHELLAYPTRISVHRYAELAISSSDSLLAAEIFADEYKGEMRCVVKEDRPPCVSCNDCAVYFCYLTEMECRVYAAWVDEIR